MTEDDARTVADIAAVFTWMKICYIEIFKQIQGSNRAFVLRLAEIEG